MKAARKAPINAVPNPMPTAAPVVTPLRPGRGVFVGSWLVEEEIVTGLVEEVVPLEALVDNEFANEMLLGMLEEGEDVGRIVVYVDVEMETLITGG